MTVEEAARILKRMYNGAPEGRRMTYVHLFGIKYADEIRSNEWKPNELVRRAGISEVASEINKGVNLAQYVQIKPDIEL